MNETLGRLLDLLNGELESAYFVMKKEYRFWFDCHWDWLLSDIYINSIVFIDIIILLYK